MINALRAEYSWRNINIFRVISFLRPEMWQGLEILLHGIREHTYTQYKVSSILECQQRKGVKNLQF